MAEAHVATNPELPNLVTILEKTFEGTSFAHFLKAWENIIFSLIIIFMITVVAYFVSKKNSMVPGRFQCAWEMFVGGVDDFVCGIMGPAGRQFVPFIGTLFIYILFMNLSGLIPLFKSPTSNWSITLALALCVFVYVQFTGFRRLGFLGYIDHLAEKPRGILAFSVIIPILMFFLHVISELVRPLSLSLRLRSNIWGDDTLLAVLAGFGLGGVPLLLFNTFLVIIAGIVQTLVFCLLTTIYFTLIVTGEEH
jgi:F-type H+-transporting ATPase subunit a